MGKYKMSLKKGREEFKVTIVADSNDGDYITTFETFSKEDFDNEVVDELIDLTRNYSGNHELVDFGSGWLSIPCSDWGCCHSLEEVLIEYTDADGNVYDVTLF